MKKVNLKKIILGSILGCIALICCIFLYYFRYRFMPLISIGNEDHIEISDLEVYTNKLSFSAQEDIEFYVKSNSNGTGYLIHNESTKVDSFEFSSKTYPFNKTESANGCSWLVSGKITPNKPLQPGYYALVAETEKDTSKFHFIIENRKKAKIAVLAPTSTWVAYNDWGGQSLYINNFEKKTTYFVSSKRPNPKQDVRVERHSTNFFLEHYNAILLPDYALEYDMDLLKTVDVIVLNHHAEYFTETMYNHLQQLIEKHKISLISLGGNQMYWKTKWNADYSQMECRKDLTSFEGNILDYGGMWRHHLNKAEHNILGVQFTDAGMHSYAPYEVLEPNHWIFKGLDLKKGDLFGYHGIDSFPLSGDETDKMVKQTPNMTLLAKGLNCSTKNPVKGFDDNCKENNGADFIYKALKSNSILSTGSIQSGSGLGVDTVFTKMIENYLKKEID